MKTISLFYGQGGERNGAPERESRRSGADEVARGPATARVVRLTVHRERKSAVAIRIGMDLTGRDQTARWEQAVFIALWLCGLFSVGYCLETLLSLPWPG